MAVNNRRFSFLLNRFVLETATADQFDELWSMIAELENNAVDSGFTEFWLERGEGQEAPVYWESMKEKARMRDARRQARRHLRSRNLITTNAIILTSILIAAGTIIIRPGRMKPAPGKSNPRSTTARVSPQSDTTSRTKLMIVY